MQSVHHQCRVRSAAATPRATGPHLSSCSLAVGPSSSQVTAIRRTHRDEEVPLISRQYQVLWLSRTLTVRSRRTPAAEVPSPIRGVTAVAVPGDAVIRGPHLVAQPARSEWRNQRPRQTNNNTKRETFQ